MSDCAEILLIALCVYVVVWWCSGSREAMTSRPDPAQRAAMTDEVMRNMEFFSRPTQLADVRESIDWIDPVVYEDMRQLYNSGRFNRSTIYKTL